MIHFVFSLAVKALIRKATYLLTSFLFMTVLSQTLFSFVRSDFMSFSFFSARHNPNNLNDETNNLDFYLLSYQF